MIGCCILSSILFCTTCDFFKRAILYNLTKMQYFYMRIDMNMCLTKMTVLSPWNIYRWLECIYSEYLKNPYDGSKPKTGLCLQHRGVFDMNRYNMPYSRAYILLSSVASANTWASKKKKKEPQRLDAYNHDHRQYSQIKELIIDCGLTFELFHKYRPSWKWRYNQLFTI